MGSTDRLDMADKGQKILQGVLQGFPGGISSSSRKVMTMSPCLLMVYKKRASKLNRVICRLLSEACGLLLESSSFLPPRDPLKPAISAVHDAVVELLSTIPKHVCKAVRNHRLRWHIRPTWQTTAKLAEIRDAAAGVQIPENRHIPHWIGHPRICNFFSQSKRRNGRKVCVKKSNALARRVCSSLYTVWIDPSFPEWRTAIFSALLRSCRAVYLIETGRRNLTIADTLCCKVAEKLAKSGLPQGEALFLEGELPGSDQR